MGEEEEKVKHDHVTGRPRNYISRKWFYRGRHRGKYRPNRHWEHIACRDGYCVVRYRHPNLLANPGFEATNIGWNLVPKGTGVVRFVGN